MKIIRLALAAMFAVLAFSALAASTASAFHPLFLTESKKELSFTGEGSKPVLRAEQVFTPATIECEKTLVSGFALNLSTLAHKVLVHFHGKCVQKINGGTNESCNEPILTKLILAELGLLTATNHKVVLLLQPAGGSTVFAEPNCGGKVTTVGGVIIGEIPATNAASEPQINVLRETSEEVFATIGKSNHQAITEIWLLGSQMGNKEELSISGFLGGPAAEEATVNLKADGKMEISTTKE